MRPALNTVVHNEAHRIEGLLTAAATFCTELIVVDQSSTDGTADLARDFGATVIVDECHGCSEPSRHLAAQHTPGRWVLHLDADEIIDPAHTQDIIDLPADVLVGIFGRVTYLDGERFTDHPDPQYRYYAKDAVQHCDRLHSRVVLDPYVRRAGGREWRTDEPWIIHTKTSAEHEIDVARYEALGIHP